jgi:prefoldin subunit 5
VESEVTFSPDILPLLLEIGAVEEKDEKNLIDFSEDEPSDELDELYERIEDIEASMEAQGEMIDEMMEGIKSLVDILNKAVQEETEKKPKHNKKK